MYKVYKKSGALQVTLIEPSYVRDKDREYVDKAGAILLQAAPGIGVDKNGNIQIDWKNKIVFAIGQNDIATLLEYPGEGDVELFHQFNGLTKKVKISSGEGRYAGTYTINFFQSSQDGEPLKAFVPLTEGEFIMFMHIVKQSIMHVLGF